MQAIEIEIGIGIEIATGIEAERRSAWLGVSSQSRDEGRGVD